MSIYNYFEIRRKAQEEIDKHNINCEIFKILLQEGFISKQEGAICDYYYLNLINPKDKVESHMIYNCPFCFAKLMLPVDTGEYDSL